MTSQEFYELNKGKYFMYGDKKVRVVGCDDEDDEGVKKVKHSLSHRISNLRIESTSCSDTQVLFCLISHTYDIFSYICHKRN